MPSRSAVAGLRVFSRAAHGVEGRHVTPSWVLRGNAKFACANLLKAEPLMTSPSFCTTTNERVYITTSSGKGANGGSQGAVGDRRAAICGANAAGAGGL